MRCLLPALLVSFPQLAFGSCVDVAAPSVPRQMRTSVAAALAADAGAAASDLMALSDGQGLQPGQSSLNTICFPTFNPTASITNQTMADRYATDEAQRVAEGIVEQQRQAAFDAEIAANDLCTAELAEVISRVETRRTTLRASVENQRVTNNTTISSAANNVAGVKAAMTTLNNVTAAEFGQTVDEIASLATKIAKCVRARAR